MLRAGHFFRDLCLCGETTKVQFKQAFTSQKEIAKEIIAFANSKGALPLTLRRRLFVSRVNTSLCAPLLKPLLSKKVGPAFRKTSPGG